MKLLFGSPEFARQLHWEDDGATGRSEGVPASLFHQMPFFSGPASLCSNPELGTNLYLVLYLQFKDKPHEMGG